MTEPATVPFIFLSLLYVAYLTLGSLKQISLEMAIAIFVFAVTIAPWTIRNYVTFKQFVFIKSCFGANLKEGMYRSGIRLPEEKHLSLAREVRGMDEVNEDKAHHKKPCWPGSWKIQLPIYGFCQRILIIFGGRLTVIRITGLTSYMVGRRVPYILLLIFGIPAMLWHVNTGRYKWELRNNRSMYHLMMLILIFTYTAIYTVMGAWNLRYHFPVEFGMFIFCAETVLYIINKVRSPSNKFLRCLEAGL